MPDKKTVIQELEYCMKNPEGSACEKCHRGGKSSMVCDSLINDAIELMKEHDKEIERLEHDYAVARSDISYLLYGDS